MLAMACEMRYNPRGIVPQVSEEQNLNLTGSYDSHLHTV